MPQDAMSREILKIFWILFDLNKASACALIGSLLCITWQLAPACIHGKRHNHKAAANQTRRRDQRRLVTHTDKHFRGTMCFQTRQRACPRILKSSGKQQVHLQAEQTPSHGCCFQVVARSVTTHRNLMLFPKTQQLLLTRLAGKTMKKRIY